MNIRDGLIPAKDRYRAFAKRFQADGLGAVTLRECPFCGHLEWSCTQTKEPASVATFPMEYCIACEEVRRRSPEVYAWMRNVVATILQNTRVTDPTTTVSASPEVTK